MQGHPIHFVKAFEIVSDYTLRVCFDDDTVQVINFLLALRGELFGPLRDLETFNQVRLDVEARNLVWPNGAEFDPFTLHDWPTEGVRMIELAQSWSEEPAEQRRVREGIAKYAQRRD